MAAMFLMDQDKMTIFCKGCVICTNEQIIWNCSYREVLANRKQEFPMAAMFFAKWWHSKSMISKKTIKVLLAVKQNQD